MSDRIEIQGKTVEAAVSEALLQMGARRDEVEIKVIEEPKSGFMGFLGGRAAKVLVRRKRSGRRGGGRRDHRVDDSDYQAHNLGKGRGRGRGGSGRSAGAKARSTEGSSRDSGQTDRGAKGGSRRGSRGRGGRGRSQEAAGQGQKQGQKQGQRQDQKQDQQKQSGGRKQGSRGRGPDRDKRQVARKDSRQDNRSRTPKENNRPVKAAREEAKPRSDTPIRPLRQESTPAPAASPVIREETKPTELKKEATVSKTNKPRRGFGGLGSRIREKQKAAQAESSGTQESPQVADTPREAPAPSAPLSGTPRAPRTSRPTERRGSSFGSAHAGEEMILAGIKGTQYAKPVGKVADEGLDEALTELTDAMLARSGFPCRCETLPGEYRQVRVTTDDASAGMLIGRHGQTVDAVEHLVERMASNAIDARARINLDINNYRMRREESLIERVAEAGARVRETERSFHMEPMSGRERRIVHLETEKLDGLRTFTMDGSGGKHVVIALEEEAEDQANSDT